MNAGIYATLTEQFALGLLVGILAVATPAIVGASVPGVAKWVLAIIAFATAAMQVFGFLGVFQEKPILFRRYTTLHIMLTVAAFAVALTWIIISATKHNTAVSSCENSFFSDDTSPGTTSAGESQTLCNIFTWVDIGLMGGLWVILAIMQFYLYTVISSYGMGQRQDHEKYKSMYSVTGLDSGIPLTNRADPWDARASIDELGDGTRAEHEPLSRGGHTRNESTASVSTILGEKQQEPTSYIAGGVVPTRQGTYASGRQGSVDERGGYPSQPSNAYTQAPQPTPYGYGDNSRYGGLGYGGMQQPGQTQPAEGMFGRKTTRLQNPYGQDYNY